MVAKIQKNGLPDKKSGQPIYYNHQKIIPKPMRWRPKLLRQSLSAEK